mmetsp:Transcript_52434/g.86963  ORF Transcript_52434/g.86963 Transcript_52434/m.86963 type:complete len:239 (-) Transcript_52434:509-1225(-)
MIPPAATIRRIPSGQLDNSQVDSCCSRPTPSCARLPWMSISVGPVSRAPPVAGLCITTGGSLHSTRVSLSTMMLWVVLTAWTPAAETRLVSGSPSSPARSTSATSTALCPQTWSLLKECALAMLNGSCARILLGASSSRQMLEVKHGEMLCPPQESRLTARCLASEPVLRLGSKIFASGLSTMTSGCPASSRASMSTTMLWEARIVWRPVAKIRHARVSNLSPSRSTSATSIAVCLLV